MRGLTLFGTEYNSMPKGIVENNEDLGEEQFQECLQLCDTTSTRKWPSNQKFNREHQGKDTAKENPPSITVKLSESKKVCLAAPSQEQSEQPTGCKPH